MRPLNRRQFTVLKIFDSQADRKSSHSLRVSPLTVAALARRGLIEGNDTHTGYRITDAGREAARQ